MRGREGARRTERVGMGMTSADARAQKPSVIGIQMAGFHVRKPVSIMKHTL